MKTLPAALALVCALSTASKTSSADFPEEIPFVPTPTEVVDKMLELAQVKKATCFTISAAVTDAS